MDRKLSLHLDEVRSALVDIGALGFEDFIECLCLQTALRDCEVDKCGTTADIGSEIGRGIACREVQTERRRKVNLLLAKLNKHTTSSLLVLLVEDVVEDRVQMFGILDQDRVTETQRALELLRE